MRGITIDETNRRYFNHLPTSMNSVVFFRATLLIFTPLMSRNAIFGGTLLTTPNPTKKAETNFVSAYI